MAGPHLTFCPRSPPFRDRRHFRIQDQRLAPDHCSEGADAGSRATTGTGAKQGSACRRPLLSAPKGFSLLGGWVPSARPLRSLCAPFLTT